MVLRLWLEHHLSCTGLYGQSGSPVRWFHTVKCTHPDHDQNKVTDSRKVLASTVTFGQTQHGYSHLAFRWAGFGWERGDKQNFVWTAGDEVKPLRGTHPRHGVARPHPAPRCATPREQRVPGVAIARRCPIRVPSQQ